MDVVVSGIPCDYQTCRGDVRTRCVLSVCVPDFHDEKVMPFELDYISLEFLCDYQMFGDLTGIARFPEIQNEFRQGLPPHGFHDIGSCNCSRFRKAIQKRSKAKTMVPMAVSDIDRGQVLAARRDPFDQRCSLFDGQKGVDENSIPLTEDECRRCRNPGPLLLARRQVADEALAIRY